MVSFSEEDDYEVTVEVFNALGSETFDVTVFVERQIQTAELNIVPSLTSTAFTDFAFQFEQDFIKGNLEIDFGDNESKNEWLYFDNPSPTTTINHRYFNYRFTVIMNLYLLTMLQILNLKLLLSAIYNQKNFYICHDYSKLLEATAEFEKKVRNKNVTHNF